MLEIKCYSSYKGEERPLKIILDNQEHFVESILRKELIEDFKTRERKTIFWCQTKDNIYKLIRLSTGEWQLAKDKNQIITTQREASFEQNKRIPRRHENPRNHGEEEEERTNSP
jgi:hypothetical protein